MWLFELIGFSVVIGTVVGLVWRFSEDWLEKRSARKMAEVELTDDQEATEAPVPTQTSTCACESCPCPHTQAN